ncbi:MAG: tetratricopeptide repeat protein [Lachnospiraceae bacterium]|nr:tetratricopeptide repeat protein [Lachnospiraceae bacterium]
MSDRFTKIFSLNPYIYAKESPVLFVAGALLQDIETGGILGQLKFRNVDSTRKHITEMVVELTCFDAEGNEMEDVVEFSYLGMSLPKNAEYGSKIPIEIPYPQTASVSLSVKIVSFEDGSCWFGTGLEWEPLPEKRYISTMIEDPELVKQFRIEFGNNSNYSYERYGNLWCCVCGAINSDPDVICIKCGKNERLLKYMDIRDLKKNCEKRLEEEAIQREIDEEAARKSRAAAEKRAADEREAAARKAEMEKFYLNKRIEAEAARQKRLMIIGVSAGAVVIALFLLITQYLIPLSKYNKAMEYKRDAKYEEAIVAFTGLGRFKDSSEQALACRQMKDDKLYNTAYIEAATLKANGEYDKAIEAFEALNGYKDSAEMIEECNQLKLKDAYDSATKLMEDGDYVGAVKVFESLDYEDSAEKAVICRNYISYEKALLYLKNGKYDDAIEIFEKLGDFENSKEKISESMIGKARALIDEGEYLDAIAILEGLLDEHPEVVTLIMDAKFGYVEYTVENKCQDEKTVEFFDELSGKGYALVNKYEDDVKKGSKKKK